MLGWKLLAQRGRENSQLVFLLSLTRIALPHTVSKNLLQTEFPSFLLPVCVCIRPDSLYSLFFFFFLTNLMFTSCQLVACSAF